MTVSGLPFTVLNRATTAARPPWMRPRTSSTSFRRSSAVVPSGTWPVTTATPLMSLADSARPAAAWSTFSARNFSISFSASFSRPSMAETFSGSSSERPLSSSVSWLTTVCSRARKL